MGRDRIVGMHLQPLPEHSTPSPIVWTHQRSMLELHSSFPLSDMFIEVKRVLLSQGYKGCVETRGFSSFSPTIMFCFVSV
jgi:hypothetical protein